jgi:hypothetical protein
VALEGERPKNAARSRARPRPPRRVFLAPAAWVRVCKGPARRLRGADEIDLGRKVTLFAEPVVSLEAAA